MSVVLAFALAPIPASAEEESEEPDHYLGDGHVGVEGNTEVLSQLGSTMATFELAFEIIPGTVAPREPEDLNDFETGPIYSAHE